MIKTSAFMETHAKNPSKNLETEYFNMSTNCTNTLHLYSDDTRQLVQFHFRNDPEEALLIFIAGSTV
jgi:hypothetical protein